MKKLFVATSFSGQVDYVTGHVKSEFRKSIEAILESLRVIGGFTVFCAIEHEGWVISNDPPEVGVAKDLEEIDASDGVLAILHDAPSAGVQYEMGYANGQNKQVFAATPAEEKLAYFNQGLVNLGNIIHISYENHELLAEQLKRQFEA